MRFKALALASVVASFALAACAGSSAESQQDVRVSMTEMRYSPKTLRVVAGEHTFIVKNTGDLRHTFSLNSLGEEVTVEPGGTKPLSIDLRPGTYRYVCRILDHEGLGMRGTLRVSAD